MNIRLKILMAPLLAVGFLVLFGLVAFSALQAQHSALDEIFLERYAHYQLVTSQEQKLANAHAGVYRFFTWVNMSDAAKIDRMTKEILGQIDAARGELQGFLDKPGNKGDAEKQLAEGTLKILEKYRKNVANALDMSTVDMNVGIAAMQTADSTFQDLQKNLQELIDTELRLSKESYDSASGRYRSMLVIAIVILVAAVALAVLMSVVMAKRIVTPLLQAIGFAAQIEGGNLNANIEVKGRDETAQLLQSLMVMRNRLREIITQINATASHVSRSSAGLSQSAQMISERSEQQSEASTSVASAIEQLTVSIGQVVDNAKDARNLSTDAGNIAKTGENVITNAVAEINNIAAVVNESSRIIVELGEQSGQISVIVNVIKEIAEQTNLLALNAAIEAARAGEQGRGFAVVADEVRNLAERTTKSTFEISEMVEKVQGGSRQAVSSMETAVECVGQGVQFARQAGDSIRQINASSSQVLTAVNDISSAIEEQNSASVEIAKLVEQIAQMSEENHQAVKESLTANREMEQLALSLQGAVKHFAV